MKKLDMSLKNLVSSRYRVELIEKKINQIIDYINADDCYKTLNELPKEERCICDNYFKDGKVIVRCRGCRPEPKFEPKEETREERVEKLGRVIDEGLKKLKASLEPKEESLRDDEEKWTMNELEKHIKANCNDTYSMAVVLSALYMKLYGKNGLPKIGLSGFQGENAERLSELFPDPITPN